MNQYPESARHSDDSMPFYTFRILEADELQSHAPKDTKDKLTPERHNNNNGHVDRCVTPENER